MSVRCHTIQQFIRIQIISLLVLRIKSCPYYITLYNLQLRKLHKILKYYLEILFYYTVLTI
jgi:hypothetical protein